MKKIIAWIGVVVLHVLALSLMIFVFQNSTWKQVLGIVGLWTLVMWGIWGIKHILGDN